MVTAIFRTGETTMAIIATRAPTTLAWSNFTSVSTLLDPTDGGDLDAYTEFNYETPTGWRLVDGRFAFADGQTVRVTPRARVRAGARQTAALLAHEQFHYDVGFVIARCVAKELFSLRAPTMADLVRQQNELIQLHFFRRVGLIQRRYDIDTGHGTNARWQAHYLRLMRECLANANANMLGGWWL